MATTSVEAAELRSAVRDLCSRFPDEYWRDIDLRLDYPKAFVDAIPSVAVGTLAGGGILEHLGHWWILLLPFTVMLIAAWMFIRRSL